MGSEEEGIGTATRVKLEHVGERDTTGRLFKLLSRRVDPHTEHRASSMICYVTYR